MCHDLLVDELGERLIIWWGMLCVNCLCMYVRVRAIRREVAVFFPSFVPHLLRFSFPQPPPLLQLSPPPLPQPVFHFLLLLFLAPSSLPFPLLSLFLSSLPTSIFLPPLSTLPSPFLLSPRPLSTPFLFPFAPPARPAPPTAG